MKGDIMYFGGKIKGCNGQTFYFEGTCVVQRDKSLFVNYFAALLMKIECLLKKGRLYKIGKYHAGKYIENKIIKEDWMIPCSNHHIKVYECMKHTKIGTLVEFTEGDGAIDGGWATTITPMGVNVTTAPIIPMGVDISIPSKTIFVKWINVLGVYNEPIEQ